ncbi:hypothetical protein B0H19DRAFT_1349004 [Mycena capillaripes]|nr:hypothetical protein B0H19DRAFT_1349004 [Mycena capillaripes]
MVSSGKGRDDGQAECVSENRRPLGGPMRKELSYLRIVALRGDWVHITAADSIAMNNAPGLRSKGTAGLLMCQYTGILCEVQDYTSRFNISVGTAAATATKSITTSWKAALGNSFKLALDLVKRKVTHNRADSTISISNRFKFDNLTDWAAALEFGSCSKYDTGRSIERLTPAPLGRQCQNYYKVKQKKLNDIESGFFRNTAYKHGVAPYISSLLAFRDWSKHVNKSSSAFLTSKPNQMTKNLSPSSVPEFSLFRSPLDEYGCGLSYVRHPNPNHARSKKRKSSTFTGEVPATGTYLSEISISQGWSYSLVGRSVHCEEHNTLYSGRAVRLVLSAHGSGAAKNPVNGIGECMCDVSLVHIKVPANHPQSSRKQIIRESRRRNERCIERQSGTLRQHSGCDIF